jgi:DNA-binding transcriptional LysR family regulator
MSVDRLHLMRVFVAVAETEGFATGARRLDISPPAATRAIAALETHLGVKLLNRTTRHVRATESGLRYLDDARRVLTAADAADDAAAGINSQPRGELAITAPVLFGQMIVTPLIVEYLARYPATSVSAMFVDRLVNLVEEGLDVGVRIGELADSSMRALTVGSVRRVLCAAPDYLARRGIPESPEQLADHSLISSNAAHSLQNWRFITAGGEQLLRISPRLTVTTNDAAREAAVGGFGITRLLSYQIAPLVAEGKLKIILADCETTPLPVHIVHREGLNAPARIRSFIDLAVAQLRSNPALGYVG